MNEIIVATANEHKKKELSKIFGDNIKLLSLNDIEFKGKIIENGKTFIDNSLIKCRAIYKAFKKPVLADDSGICTEALLGAPGVFSARFGGEKLTDRERNHYLLKLLKKHENKKASFVCALSLFINPNNIIIVQEELCGMIIDESRGDKGFGYDPIFYLPELKKTVAELSEEEKNEISHRGKAAKLMQEILIKKSIF
jgi:XTP/dITP diphosphohydrolase